MSCERPRMIQPVAQQSPALASSARRGSIWHGVQNVPSRGTWADRRSSRRGWRCTRGCRGASSGCGCRACRPWATTADMWAGEGTGAARALAHPRGPLGGIPGGSRRGSGEPPGNTGPRWPRAPGSGRSSAPRSGRCLAWACSPCRSSRTCVRRRQGSERKEPGWRDKKTKRDARASAAHRFDHGVAGIGAKF